jgi:hypothetical protein
MRGSIWACSVAILGLGFAVSEASGATLIPLSSFVEPTIVTFTNPPSSSYVSPNAYTEAGATFRAGVPGGILFLYSGILDLAYSALSYPAGLLDVSFAGPERRFGFEANPSNADILNPSPWEITRVDFFSNGDFTSLLESYTVGFNVGTSPAFFALESTGEFRSVQIAILSGGGGFSPYLDDFRFESVPEQPSIALLGIGLSALLGFVRRRRTY